MSSSTTAPKLPLEIIGGTIDSFEAAELKELVKQNVKMVILTYQGERIMQPDFGVGVPRYLFDQIGTGIYSELQSVIATQLKKYIPSINLTSVSAVAGDDDHKLSVSVSYEIDFLRTKDQLDLLIEY